MDNQTEAILSALGTEYSSAQPDQGYGAGGEWPEEGEHNCYIKACDIGTGEFRHGDEAVPCATVSFRYELCEDPHRDTPLCWQGKTFFLPNPEKVTLEKPRTTMRITLERLAGHIKTLLRREPSGNLMADLKEVEALLDSGTTVACTVRVSEDRKGTRIYRTEKLMQLLSV